VGEEGWVVVWIGGVSRMFGRVGDGKRLGGGEGWFRVGGWLMGLYGLVKEVSVTWSSYHDFIIRFEDLPFQKIIRLMN
jgi:hypothetical protein